MIHKILQQFLRLGTRCAIRLDGKEIEGYFKLTGDCEIEFVDNDGAEISLSGDVAKSIDAIMMVAPVKETVIQKPVMVEGNAKIVSYNQGRGTLSYQGISKAPIHLIFSEKSILDDELYCQAKAGDPQSLVGQEVFCGPGKPDKNKEIWTTFVLKPGTLDSMLDAVRLYAGEGRLTDAYHICHALYLQYGDNDDVRRYHDILQKAYDDYIQRTQIDLYAPVDPDTDEHLRAKGRIIAFNGKWGKIFDIDSHQELRFVCVNLLFTRDSGYIGLPVTYTTIKNNQGNYEARAIIEPMEVSNALALARQMDTTKDLNAWGIGKTILEQYPDDDDAQQLVRQKEASPYVQGKKWELVTPERYAGRWQERILQLCIDPEKIVLPPHAKNIKEETHVVRSTEQLCLTSRILDADAVDAVDAVKTVDNVDAADGVKAANSVKAEPVRPKPAAGPQQAAVPNADVAPKKRITFTGKTIGTDFESLAKAVLDVNTNEAEAENVDMLAPTHVVRERNRYWFFIDDLKSDLDGDIHFTLNDIVDPELLEQASNELRKDKDLKDEQIVCQVDQAKKTAYAVFKPMAVMRAIEMARSAGEESYRHLDDDDFETADRLKLKAVGVLDCVIDQFPNCREAIDLRFKLIKGSRNLAPAPYDDQNETDAESRIRNGFIKVTSSKNENHQIVPGCIYDDLSQQIIQYSPTSIIDLDLQEKVGTPVIYSIQERQGKPIAWCIHSAKTLEDLIAFADELESKRKMPLEAWGVVNQGLCVAPNNEELLAHQASLETNSQVQKRPKLLQLSAQEGKGNDSHRAGRQALHGRDFELAMSLLQQAIREYDDTLATTFDTDTETKGMHLNAESKRRECINTLERGYREWCSACPGKKESIMREYRAFGEKYLLSPRKGNADDLKSLMNYHLFFNERKEYLQVLENLAQKYSGTRTVNARRQLTNVYAKIAEYHLQENSIDKARKVADRAIKNDENNPSALAKVIIAVINCREGSKCRDYVDYDKFDLKRLLEIKPVDCWPVGEQENVKNVNTDTLYYHYLTKFIGNYDQADIFSILGKWLLAERSKPADIDAENEEGAPCELSNKDYVAACRLLNCMNYYKLNWVRWKNLMEVCVVNGYAARIIFNLVYDINPAFCAKFISRFGDPVDANATKLQMIDAFERVRSNLGYKYNTWIGHSTKLQRELQSSEQKLESCRSYFQVAIVPDETWMLDSDVRLVKMINGRIPEYLEECMGANSTRAASQAYKETQKYIHNVEMEIGTRPTLLSIYAIKPLLEVLQKALDALHNSMQMCEPKPELQILTASAVDRESCVNFHIRISNREAWSAPIQQQQLTIDWNNGDEHISKCIQVSGEIFGSETKDLLVRTKVEHPERLDSSVACKIEYRYSCRDGQSHNSLELEQCVQIPDFKQLLRSPYAASGTKCENTEMFYGRKEFIETLCLNLSTDIYGQYLIYGQKRSGKTSLLHHLKKAIEQENAAKTIPSVMCAETSYLDVPSTDNGNCTHLAYYRILESLKNALEDLQNQAKRRFRAKYAECRRAGIDTSHLAQDPVPQFELPEQNCYCKSPESPEKKFETYMENFKKLLNETQGWENIKIIVMIDEFTSVHKAIKDGLVASTFMQTWKRLQEQESTRFASILIGQDVAKSLQHDYSNVYSIIHDSRLTYLASEDALKLITEPMGKIGVRYAENSEKRVLHYTAGNPYYIWLFCHQLVNQLNAARCYVITDRTIEDAAEFLSKDLDEKYFDNLALAGEDEKVSEYSKEQNETVLRRIALETEKNGSCSQAALVRDYTGDDGKTIDGILKSLEDREVISREGSHYSIIVKLYSKWLCEQHRKIL